MLMHITYCSHVYACGGYSLGVSITGNRERESYKQSGWDESVRSQVLFLP